MTTVALQDPQSGQEVRLGLMQLGQRCPICAAELEGRWGMATSDGLGWTCLDHHVRRTMSLAMSGEARARARAREQLAGASVGDRVVLTGSILAALGLTAAA